MTETTIPATLIPRAHGKVRIDAHQHFWHYSPEQYRWIDETMHALQQDLLPEHLAREMAAAGIDGVVAVQACEAVAETEWLLALAETHRWILGVVGWMPLAGPAFEEQLERLGSHRLLKGLRHCVQAETDPEFLLREPFARGIRALRDRGLIYDVLIREHQLAQAIRFVDQHPQQLFVLDHLAKPKIAEGLLEPWATQMCELARRENVYCKLSGMVTEARWQGWTPEDLQPYLEVALQAFGPQRLMAGSDWPVCLVAASYAEWMSSLESLLGKLSDSERERIFGGTAMQVYGLEPELPAKGSHANHGTA